MSLTIYLKAISYIQNPSIFDPQTPNKQYNHL